MIAIKQAKFKTPSSNKIQEKQIKITTNTAVNSTKSATDSSNTIVANRQISGSSSSNHNINNNHQNHNDNECPEQPTLVRSTSNDQRNDSQISRNESNETRSETNNIDGATKTSSISSKLLQAHTPPSQPPTSSRPSTPHPSSASSPLSSSSSSEPASVTAASMEPTTQTLASYPTTATLSPHPTTASLITASTRIKQRQQKFLAAAAKSATSPHYTSNQNSMTSKQATRLRESPAPCATMSSDTNNLSGVSSRFTKVGAGKRYQVSMSIINGPCCRQTFNCCRYANQQMIDPEMVGANKGVAYDSTDDICQSVVKDHDGTETNDTRRDRSQMSCKKQTHHQAASKPIADASPMPVARTKVLSMATMISGASGSGLQRAKGRTNKGSDDVASDNRSSRTNDHRRSISCASNANTVDCAELSSKPASLASVNVGDINRRVARLSCGDGDASYNIREHQQEMRRSGDNKDKDDNIDIKYNRPDNQNYHHHYYNHNYQQYQQQHQPNRLHPKYQPAHQQSTQLLNKTVTQPQYHQPQHIMAHYKFHNDCQSSVLTYEQVERLDSVMNQVVPLYGRGNAPTLFVKLKELIKSVRYKLQHEHSIEIRDVRLNGGTASYVLAPENSHYNDLDLVFVTDLSDEGRFDVIRDVVLDCLMEFYPDRHGIRPSDQFDIKQNLSPELSAENTNATNHQTNREQQTGPIADDDLEEASGQSLRSERSSSFESDNLNITTELDEDSSDDEDNIIVRIDDDDTRKSKISTSLNGDVTDTKLCENIDRTLTNEQVDNQKLSANNSIDGMNFGGIMMATERRGVEQVVDDQSNPLHGFHYQSNQMPPNNCAIKEAYVHKMVKVNDDDRWSLISLGVQQSETNSYNQQQLSSSTHNDARVAACGVGDSDTSACCDLSLLTYQPRNHAQRQKQFPNSIELKFVDRMRRKFEFSVDSFQIILDSLIQFYDYAPQSTITIQKKSSKLQTVPAIFDPRHLSNRMVCANYDRTHKYLFYRKASDDGLICSNGENGRSAHLFNLNPGKKNQHEKHQRVSETLNSTRSFCELPLEPGNSLSNSSVASSSGCSSSSSVVSSSSSSLSCDDDPDVLCCDSENAPSSCAAISENFYPTVIGRSEYGNFKEALYHLEKKLIATRSPEEIRGGGLLKYCNLLVKNYKPTNVYQIRTLERYMCSRFFIDFSDLNQQRAKLESYLANHFSDDPLQKYDYLTILYNVVQRSTVCLMNHELRLTLGMVRELAYNLNEQQAKQHQYVAQ